MQRAHQDLTEVAFWCGLAGRPGHSYSREQYHLIMEGVGEASRSAVIEGNQIWMENDLR